MKFVNEVFYLTYEIWYNFRIILICWIVIDWSRLTQIVLFAHFLYPFWWLVWVSISSSTFCWMEHVDNSNIVCCVFVPYVSCQTKLNWFHLTLRMKTSKKKFLQYRNKETISFKSLLHYEKVYSNLSYLKKENIEFVLR